LKQSRFQDRGKESLSSLSNITSRPACKQTPGADGKKFGERETEELGERSDRGGRMSTGYFKTHFGNIIN